MGIFPGRQFLRIDRRQFLRLTRKQLLRIDREKLPVAQLIDSVGIYPGECPVMGDEHDCQTLFADFGGQMFHNSGRGAVILSVSGFIEEKDMLPAG